MEKKIVGDEIINNSKEYNFFITNPDNLEMDRKFDACIGIGGGKSIDVAKYISIKTNIPWISFPTALSNDGIFHSRTSFNPDKNNTLEAKLPKAVVIDIDLIASSPYRLNASGAGDVISNLSAVEDWRIADSANKEKFNNVVAKISESSVEKIKQNIDEIKNWTYEGAEALLKALMMSATAMNSWSSSRPCSGSEHNISHTMKNSGLMHGEEVAMATILTTHLQGNDSDSIIELNRELKLPTKITNEMVSLLQNAKNIRERYTILNEIDINEENVLDIIKDSGIL